MAHKKAMGELLVSDMSRRGMIDGRSLRLPTITVRPGKTRTRPRRVLPAASSANHSLVSMPSARWRPPTRVWVQSPPRVIDNLLIGHEAPAAAFGFDRSISVPGISPP